MRITVIDASNYLRGLLLLIRIDRKITQSEIDLMRRIGKALGFEKKFCENAIGEILENTYIVDEPPLFSQKELAMKFVKDGLALAFSDYEVHPREEAWLQSTAEKNGLDADFFPQERENARNRKEYPVRLEVDGLTIEHS